jgi:hypothetical protein
VTLGEAMIKQIISACVLFLLLSGNTFAKFAVYTIDKKIAAVFPANPQFAGEIGEGKHKYRSYTYTDESNLIIYSATYQVGKTRFKKSDVPEALSNYVKGHALLVDGSVKAYTNKNVDGNNSAVFYVEFQYQGVPVRKFGVVSYKNGHFYHWTVQDIPLMSKLNAQNIFNTYLRDFSVK